MDLKSGYPWWAIKNGLIHAFPRLDADVRCDVVVIGGGITGALIANELVEVGHEVVVLERRDIGWGSTAASTALLQYEIDTHLVDLSRQYGEAAAVAAYRACADAIAMIGDIAGVFRDVEFRTAGSLYVASRKRDLPALEAEYLLRRSNGFDVVSLDAGQVRDRYGFDAHGALLSRPAAVTDPYRLAFRLLMRLQARGALVFDRTAVDSILPMTRGVGLCTVGGAVVKARHVVIAAGYESQAWLADRVARNRSTYAFISDPVDRNVLGILRRTMLWETARPYLYLRTTHDDRVLVGGEDDAVDIPAKRDARVDAKVRRLLDRARLLFPQLGLIPAFSWGGTFAETPDGLPFLGAHPQYGPRVLFAMAYGGNGITYSMIGADIIRAAIERRKHPLASLFGFGRLSDV